MASYEYKRGTSQNNVITQAGQITTGAREGAGGPHTSKYGTVYGVTAINILTGSVTYHALQGSGYGMSIPFTGVITDKHVDAMEDPYRVPARLTILGDLSPASSNYGTLN